jgi:hypothetical protein
MLSLITRGEPVLEEEEEVPQPLLLPEGPEWPVYEDELAEMALIAQWAENGIDDVSYSDLMSSLRGAPVPVLPDVADDMEDQVYNRYDYDTGMKQRWAGDSGSSPGIGSYSPSVDMNSSAFLNESTLSAHVSSPTAQPRPPVTRESTLNLSIHMDGMDEFHPLHSLSSSQCTVDTHRGDIAASSTPTNASLLSSQTFTFRSEPSEDADAKSEKSVKPTPHKGSLRNLRKQ